MPTHAHRAIAALLATLAALHATPPAAADTQLVFQNGKHQLLVDGQPFYIKGAGGDGDKTLLRDSGANAFRTWGVDVNTQALLDEAEQLGLKVAIGLWLGHDRHGFDYDDPAAVQQQFDSAKAAVLQFKDHPALLLWGVGNEMEEYAAETNPKVWKAVNDIAAMIKQLDGKHPTMTVIAEIGGDRLESIGKLCPDIDLVGINTYGGVSSIPTRYAEQREQGHIDKPYLVAEFGPPGTWEIPRNDWDVPEELTSTAKANVYANAYATLKADPHCVGSFAFTWGFKQEATATWFGMFLPDGSKLAAVDAMTHAWTGKLPDNQAPAIHALDLVGSAQAKPGDTLELKLQTTDPEGQPLRVEWTLFQEMDEFESMGDFRPTPPTFPDAITQASNTGATLTLPKAPGNYRVFAYVYDDQGGAAVANRPLQVQDESQPAVRGLPVDLPLVLYGDHAQGSPYAPSGFMGATDAIVMIDNATVQPQAGDTCLQVEFNQNNQWAGVVWQHPVHDWGDLEGGFDLADAKHLRFWARGHRGGEQVAFGFGLLGDDKPFPDTAKAELAVTLTNDWQAFTIPLQGKDLARIKTGFYWTAAAAGQPLKFYLDNIEYTAD